MKKIESSSAGSIWSRKQPGPKPRPSSRDVLVWTSIKDALEATDFCMPSWRPRSHLTNSPKKLNQRPGLHSLSRRMALNDPSREPTPPPRKLGKKRRKIGNRKNDNKKRLVPIPVAPRPQDPTQRPRRRRRISEATSKISAKSPVETAIKKDTMPTSALSL